MLMSRCSPAKRSFALIAVVLLLAAGLSGCARRGGDPGGNTGAVPEKYQKLYDDLKASMDGYNASLDLRSERYAPPAFGAELLPANGNRGEGLLKPENRKGTIAYLDGLRDMGVQGVTIAMPYPMYMPGSPRHDEYAAYYRYVFDEIRKRGMIAEVETGVIFSGTSFSPVHVDFGGMTYGQYVADKKLMVQAIIDDLHPDYLDLGAEPDTEYKLTGWAELNSPAKYAGYVSSVLDGLDRDGTKVGAGIGSWGDTAYVDEYVRTGLDFIAIHVYPVEPRFLDRIDEVARIARAHNKSIVMDECWLYKTRDYAGGFASNDEAFKRDSYAFWAPLDQEFLALMARSAQANGVEYVSPFWANFFFAYADYEPAMDKMSYGEVVEKSNRAAAGNIVAGKLSPTGEYYRRLIAESR